MRIKMLIALATLLSGSAFAADGASRGVTPNLDQGTRMIEGAGSMDVMADELRIQLAYGRMVADGIEVGLVAGLFDNDQSMSTELGIRSEYNFVMDSAWVPFLGAGVVWADVEADERGLETDAAVVALGGGVKYFIRDDVALALDGRHLTASDEIFVDREDGELKDDEFRMLFSVRFYFD